MKPFNYGEGNTGNRNKGNYNSGDLNSGFRNSGNRNSGFFNAGNKNIGNHNTGKLNKGDYNVGVRNLGKYNIGGRNVGNHNIGDMNIGHHNVGMGNLGDYNIGDFNESNYQMGSFNTITWKELRFFDKKVDLNEYMSIDEWHDHPARELLYWIKCIYWIDDIDMSEEERDENEDYKTTGGYFKHIPLKKAAVLWKRRLWKCEIEVIKSVPNFDNDIFERILGVRL